MIQFLKKTSPHHEFYSEQGPLPQSAFSPEDEDVPSLDDNDALSPGDDNVPLPNVGTSASARALKRKRVSSRSTDTKATKKRVKRIKFMIKRKAKYHDNLNETIESEMVYADSKDIIWGIVLMDALIGEMMDYLQRI